MQIDISLLVTFITIVSLVLAIAVSVIKIYYYKERIEVLDKSEETEAITVREAPVFTNYKCPLCNGDGIYKGKKCEACKGIGMFRAPQDSVVCGTCGGSGTFKDKKKAEKKCKICKGRGRVPSFPIEADYEDYEMDD